jgi:hypothetical protein
MGNTRPSHHVEVITLREGVVCVEVIYTGDEIRMVVRKVNNHLTRLRVVKTEKTII